ncbi:MAG: hypothetical protein F6K58_09155 [Symploca sp. SIO2E9]|nr:hypothetical protein [Symploca sp. SIO2E9]
MGRWGDGEMGRWGDREKFLSPIFSNDRKLNSDAQRLIIEDGSVGLCHQPTVNYKLPPRFAPD